MAQSPDGRTSSDSSCYECPSPSGSTGNSGWGVWMQAYGPNSSGRWMWQPVPPPPAPPNYIRTTPTGIRFTSG